MVDTSLPLENVSDNVDILVNEYFSNYFSPQISFTTTEYDAVKSFFQEKTNQNEQATAALTAAVLNAANELQVYPAEIIDQFKESNNLKVAVPLFLNLTRSSTSILGYVNDRVMPKNIARQIKA